MSDLKLIIKEENDEELIELAKEDISNLETEIENLNNDLQEQLIPKDVRDKADAIVEVRAGTGVMKQVYSLERFLECIRDIQNYKTGHSN